jgi:hypothetical protein
MYYRRNEHPTIIRPVFIGMQRVDSVAKQS